MSPELQMLRRLKGTPVVWSLGPSLRKAGELIFLMENKRIPNFEEKLAEVKIRTRALRHLKREGLAITRTQKATPYSKQKTITYYYITPKGLKLLKELGL